MKNYDQRMENIRAKADQLKSRRRTVTCGCMLLAVVLTLSVLTPYFGLQLGVEPKYQLIPAINMNSYHIVGNGSDYEWLKEALTSRPTSSNDDFPATDKTLEELREELEELRQLLSAGVLNSESTIGAVVKPSYNSSNITNSVPEYVEVTDNQVQGVIESDIFKRSDKYIYYLRDNKLSVFSIDEIDSAELATLEFEMKNTVDLYDAEMFLSSDCTTLTVLFDEYVSGLGSCTVVYSLDVSDPTNILVQEPLIFKGSYISSRMVDDKLLLIYNYNDVYSVDLDNPENFVPVYGTQDELQLIPAENIFCPTEKPTSARYTVIAQLDAKTLQVEDTAALLGYSREVHVSQSTIYATYSYTRRVEQESMDGMITRTAMTDITGISYGGDNLNILGTVTVEGDVKDQYSLDEYNGVLRVATSTSVVEAKWQLKWAVNYGQGWVEHGEWDIVRKDNCNLYCIDLSSWEIASSVTAFAPDGDEVTSARFDGPVGYICTAEVVTMRDPVYYFDLSDIYNITYKHTPIIDGYSSSLINFGEYLLGIGYNEDFELKVEVYKETAEGVEPVASYERTAGFSQEYKSYYIDRERNLVGLALQYQETGLAEYVLLCFDGDQLVEMAKIPIVAEGFNVGSIFFGKDLGKCRADIIDGYLYLLEETLHVKRLWIE